MSTEFTKLIQSAILDGSIPAKVLARRIGKPYSTLLREINPHDAGAKLGVETLIAILKVTGDATLIEYLANELGFDIVPRKLQRTG